MALTVSETRELMDYLQHINATGPNEEVKTVKFGKYNNLYNYATEVRGGNDADACKNVRIFREALSKKDSRAKQIMRLMKEHMGDNYPATGKKSIYAMPEGDFDTILSFILCDASENGIGNFLDKYNIKGAVKYSNTDAFLQSIFGTFGDDLCDLHDVYEGSDSLSLAIMQNGMSPNAFVRTVIKTALMPNVKSTKRTSKSTRSAGKGTTEDTEKLAQIAELMKQMKGVDLNALMNSLK